ncbi:hypothetical protein ACH4TP_38075 [Streptomyces sp. NPDC021012]|uniref:hypothetical protein n=1 Tax=Streptomyces sp. NPDC021012 TaxID=3365107 RepID=UPI0037BC752E
MQNFRVTWTQDGQPKRSGVAYDLPSAEHRKVRLEQETGVADVEIVPEKPGV